MSELEPKDTLEKNSPSTQDPLKVLEVSSEAVDEALGADLYKVSAVVANHGYLPTYLTQRALEHGTAGSVSVAPPRMAEFRNRACIADSAAAT